jgi:transcription elongation GreA/GreB family factor
VLSPIGLALIGRERGSFAKAAMPNGKELIVRVVDTERRDHALREAA